MIDWQTKHKMRPSTAAEIEHYNLIFYVLYIQIWKHSFLQLVSSEVDIHWVVMTVQTVDERLLVMWMRLKIGRGGSKLARKLLQKWYVFLWGERIVILNLSFFFCQAINHPKNYANLNRRFVEEGNVWSGLARLQTCMVRSRTLSANFTQKTSMTKIGDGERPR